MRIVYYTSSTTGIGRLVRGMAIGNALDRRGVSCTFTIVHSSSLGHFADNYNTVWVPIETESDLAPGKWQKSVLYKTLQKLKPDILLVNHTWFMLHNFMDHLPGKKLYVTEQVFDRHFRIPLPSGTIVFDPRQYDRVIAVEPFRSAISMEEINPMILRNRDEIMPRETALKRLGLDGEGPFALYALSGRPEYFDAYREKYSYLEKEGYRMVYSGTYRDGIFPVVDYFNAFDLIVGGVGYNLVWEVNFFNKKALFEVLDVKFSDQAIRQRTAESFHFDINGADQLVDIILSM